MNKIRIFNKERKLSLLSRGTPMRFEGSRRFDGSALSPETEEMNWFKR